MFLLQIILSFFSAQLFAFEIQCNKNQTMCILNLKDFTVGDDVGFFSADRKLLAKGTVKKIEGARRIVEITSRTGKITKESKVSLLNPVQEEARIIPKYEIYKGDAPRFWGAHLGLGTLLVGGSSPMFELAGHYGMRLNKGPELFLEGIYGQASGKVTKTATSRPGTEEYAYSMMHIAFVPSIGYTFFKQQDVSAQVRGGIGLAYVMGSVSGDPADISYKEYQTNLKSGVVMMAKVQALALYNLFPYRLSAGATGEFINQAFAPLLIIGMAYELD